MGLASEPGVWAWSVAELMNPKSSVDDQPRILGSIRLTDRTEFRHETRPQNNASFQSKASYRAALVMLDRSGY